MGGLQIGVGVRALVSEMIELEAGLQHVDVDDDEQSVIGGIRFHASDQFSIGASALIGDDVTSLSLDGRLAF